MSREEIIRANPIVDFVRNRGHKLMPAGKNFLTSGSPATRHKPGHRPVTIYPANNSWYDHDLKMGGSVIDWVMHEQGVTAADAMRQLGGGNNGATESKIVATYDYTDEGGKLLFQTVRYEPKDFSQRRPDGTSNWIWGLTAGEYVQRKNGDWYRPNDRTPPASPRKHFDAVKPVLYRLPELRRDLKRGLPVIVMEGEKDVDAVAKLGLQAAVTCNAMGAGKWRDEYSETLRGAKVFVIADKDKTGRDHAERAAASLLGKAKRVAVLELPDRNGQRVKDPSDWIAAGGNARELAGLLDAAPEWTSQTSDDSEQWPDPEPLPADMPAVPAFNFDCLPETLRPRIKDISERMQCPPDFPAVATIIGAGSVLGRKIGIRPKRHDDWLEIANLWGEIIAPPGFLKTPALQEALIPLRQTRSPFSAGPNLTSKCRTCARQYGAAQAMMACYNASKCQFGLTCRLNGKTLTFDELYAVLRDWAVARKPQTYGQLSRAYQARTGDWFEPYRSWDAPLGRLNNLLAAVGAPALSALVIVEKTNEPGGGFWDCAPNVPKRPQEDSARLSEWNRILKDVFAYQWPPTLPP